MRGAHEMTATAMVLQELWQLKAEKLQGLSPGVTFTQGKPAIGTRRYYAQLLTRPGVTAPEGSKGGAVAAPSCASR